MLGILLPSYKRPKSIERVAENIKATTKIPYNLYFCLEKEDHASIKAIKLLKYNYYLNKHEPSFSGAIQTIYGQTKDDILFPANDDFNFLEGWYEQPLEYLKENPNIMVLGVHDGNPKTKYHSVHFVRRAYIKDVSGVVDMPDRVYYPYNHNYVDDEITNTAISRGVWNKVDSPCIEHQHPSFDWLGRFSDDETYRKNIATFNKDAETYNSRCSLW